MLANTGIREIISRILPDIWGVNCLKQHADRPTPKEKACAILQWYSYWVEIGWKSRRGWPHPDTPEDVMYLCHTVTSSRGQPMRPQPSGLFLFGHSRRNVRSQVRSLGWLCVAVSWRGEHVLTSFLFMDTDPLLFPSPPGKARAWPGLAYRPRPMEELLEHCQLSFSRLKQIDDSIPIHSKPHDSWIIRHWGSMDTSRIWAVPGPRCLSVEVWKE